MPKLSTKPTGFSNSSQTPEPPSPGFAIIKKPGPFSNVHFKFHFSIANAACKRTLLIRERGDLVLANAADENSPVPTGNMFVAARVPAGDQCTLVTLLR